MLDVDHFKRINDRCGHLTGDLVLSAVGRLLRDNVRVEETAARFGGDEFAVLMPGADIEAARTLAERIGAAVERHEFRDADAARPVRVTVSVGAAVRAAHEPPVALLARADRALYRAKLAGRNRVALAS